MKNKINITCPGCGKNIVIDKSKIPQGEKIEVECEKCGAVVFVKV